MSRYYVNVPFMFRWYTAEGNVGNPKGIGNYFDACPDCQSGQGWHFWVEGLDDNVHVETHEEGLAALKDMMIERYTLPHYYATRLEIERKGVEEEQKEGETAEQTVKRMAGKQ